MRQVPLGTRIARFAKHTVRGIILFKVMAYSFVFRAKHHVAVLFIACAQLGIASYAQGATWICPQADGSEIYSDLNSESTCRKATEPPALQRGPVISRPQENTNLEEKMPTLHEPVPLPEAGRGRKIDPPSDTAITYRLVVGNDVRIGNADASWTAEKICIEVKKSGITTIAPSEVLCIDALKPGEVRTVAMSSKAPTNDLSLRCLQWKMPKGSLVTTPPMSSVQITDLEPGQPYDFSVENLDPQWTAKSLCVKVKSAYGSVIQCVDPILPLQKRGVKIPVVSVTLPYRLAWDTSAICVQWVR